MQTASAQRNVWGLVTSEMTSHNNRSNSHLNVWRLGTQARECRMLSYISLSGPRRGEA